MSESAPDALNPNADDVLAKLARLRDAMRREGLGGALLGGRRNFAWLTDGARSHVSRSDAAAAGKLLVTRERAYLIADNIETPRFLAEGIDPKIFEPVEWPWHKSPPDALLRLAKDPVASDAPGDGRPDAERWVAPLRWTLTARERDRVRWIGRRVGHAATAVAENIRSGMTEREVEAALSAKLLADEIFPAVILVGADERIERYRHPIPTEKRVERGAMVVVTAERWGLHLSCTRFGWPEPPDAERVRRLAACRRIEEAMRLATRPGATLGHVLQKGVDAYAREGFPKEWERHHQGGLAGYAPREVFAKPGDFTPVEAGRLYAWNPSISGAKSEDSFLVAETDAEVVTI